MWQKGKHIQRQRDVPSDFQTELVHREKEARMVPTLSTRDTLATQLDRMRRRVDPHIHGTRPQKETRLVTIAASIVQHGSDFSRFQKLRKKVAVQVGRGVWFTASVPIAPKLRGQWFLHFFLLPIHLCRSPFDFVDKVFIFRLLAFTNPLQSSHSPTA